MWLGSPKCSGVEEQFLDVGQLARGPGGFVRAMSFGSSEQGEPIQTLGLCAEVGRPTRCFRLRTGRPRSLPLVSRPITCFSSGSNTYPMIGPSVARRLFGTFRVRRGQRFKLLALGSKAMLPIDFEKSGTSTSREQQVDSVTRRRRPSFRRPIRRRLLRRTVCDQSHSGSCCAT